jgi:hypothetical protein
VQRGGAPDTSISLVGRLRSACETLYEMRPDLVSAISVTAHLPTGSEEEARPLRELSQHLANEFGFEVSVTVRGSFLSVRFARPSVEPSNGKAHP